MKYLIALLFLIKLSVSSQAIEIKNKAGATFRGELLEILPDATGGPAAKIRRDNDGRIFSVPLNVLSEKTLIELLLTQSRKANVAKNSNAPEKEVAKATVRPLEKRGKKIDGYNVIMSSDETEKDIKVDFEPQRIESHQNSMTIYGKLTNNYEQDCEFCRVTVELLDRSGKFIIRDNAYSEPSTIKPKQVGNIEIFVLSDLLIKNKVATIVYKVTGEID